MYPIYEEGQKVEVDFGGRIGVQSHVFIEGPGRMHHTYRVRYWRFDARIWSKVIKVHRDQVLRVLAEPDRS